LRSIGKPGVFLSDLGDIALYSVVLGGRVKGLVTLGDGRWLGDWCCGSCVGWEVLFLVL